MNELKNTLHTPKWVIIIYLLIIYIVLNAMMVYIESTIRLHSTKAESHLDESLEYRICNRL